MARRAMVFCCCFCTFRKCVCWFRSFPVRLDIGETKRLPLLCREMRKERKEGRSSYQIKLIRLMANNGKIVLLSGSAYLESRYSRKHLSYECENNEIIRLNWIVLLLLPDSVSSRRSLISNE